MKEITEAHIRDFFYNAATSYGFIKVEKELLVEGLRIDIFAIDANHNPYIVEFKKNKNRHIVGQAAQYLAIVPSYREEISKKLNFYAVQWENLSILLIAPDFYERDLVASTYAPLEGRVHFYIYKIVETARRKIFGLSLTYAGPSDSGPIKLPENIKDSSDLLDSYHYFEKLDTRESKREYYTNHVVPILEEIKQKTETFTLGQNLHFHTTYFNGNLPCYMIRIGTDKKRTHRASIILGFYPTSIIYGFDLTHSLREGQFLAKLLQNDQKNKEIVEIFKNLPSNYYLYAPNTGFDVHLPISFITAKALSLMLTLYKPHKRRDCYFSVYKIYDGTTLDVSDAVAIIIDEYEKFQKLFELLR